MKMTNNSEDVSKFLSFVLRHKPEAIGLVLDSEGWAIINEIIEKSDFKLSKELIAEIVETSNKKRFTISEDGLRIRANQGHSINVDIGLKVVEPPQFLYHGTATRFLSSIRREGLNPGQRQHVHLTQDRNTALLVGKRYGEPVVLKIETGKMYQQKKEFYLSENGVWLTKEVPAEYIKG